MGHGLMQLERNTRELQENVMQVRMMPISFTFQCGLGHADEVLPLKQIAGRILYYASRHQ